VVRKEVRKKEKLKIWNRKEINEGTMTKKQRMTLPYVWKRQSYSRRGKERERETSSKPGRHQIAAYKSETGGSRTRS
jgi:hypothetical protein